jgi:hypothetical protein
MTVDAAVVADIKVTLWQRFVRALRRDERLKLVEFRLATKIEPVLEDIGPG